MHIKKYIYLVAAISFCIPASSQTIDPEALAAILQQSAEGQQAKTETYESFTQTNYGQTLTLLEELDLEEERNLFYSSLMQERIELVSKLCAKDPSLYSNTVTAIMVPEGIDSTDVVKTAYNKYNTSFGGGLNKVAGKLFRIGHLGDLNSTMILGAISTAELAMYDVGIKFELGSGVAAAIKHLKA